MDTSWAIARSEYGRRLRSPVSLASGVLFLLLAGFFFREHVLFYRLRSLEESARPVGAGPLRLTDGIVRPYFGSLALLSLALLPFLAMGLAARERRGRSAGACADPAVRPEAVALGSFLGALLFHASLLLLTLAFPLFLAAVARPDPGPLVGGYLGLFFFSSSVLGLGILVSSLLASRVAGALGALALVGLVWTAGWGVGVSAPGAGGLLEPVSLFHRYARFAAGLVDAGDAAFLVACALVALALSAARLASGGRRGGWGLPIAAALALLVVPFADRFGPRLDLTTSGEHDLGPATLRIVGSLRVPVRATAFFRPEDPGASAARDLLDAYAIANPLFRFSVVDPDRNPDATRVLGFTAYGSVAVESGGKRETASAPEEAEVSAALLRLAEGRRRSVRFSAGSGEREPGDAGEGGISRAAARLRDEGFEVGRADLLPGGGIPGGTDLLVLAGPARAPAPAAIDSIEAHVRRGGQALLLFDPETASDLMDLLDRFGLEAPREVIVDRSGGGRRGEMQMTAVARYDRHEATRGLRGAAFFWRAVPLLPRAGDSGDAEIRPLLHTAPEAWGETDSLLLAGGKAVFREGEDRKGPLLFGAVVTVRSAEGKRGRLLVVGDSDFASNRFHGAGANGDLFALLAGWLARENGTDFAIPARGEGEPLLLPGRQERALTALTLGVLPGGAMVAGLLLLIRGRGRG